MSLLRPLLLAATTILLVLITQPIVTHALTYNSYGPRINLTVQSSTLFGTPTAGIAPTGNGLMNQAFSGDGDLFVTGRFNSPANVLYHTGKKRIYVNDRPYNYGALRVVDLNAGTISTACGNQSQPTNTYKDGQCSIGAPIGTGGSLRWSAPNNPMAAIMTLDVTRDYIYVIDPLDYSIHKADISVYDPVQSKGPMVSTIVNANKTGGTTSCGTIAIGTSFSQPYDSSTFQLCHPTSVSVDETKNILYIADAVYGGIVAIDFNKNFVSSVLVNINFSMNFTSYQIGRVFYRPLTNSLMIGSLDGMTSFPSSQTLQTRIIIYRLTSQTYVTFPTDNIPPLVGVPIAGVYSYIAGPDDTTIFFHPYRGADVRMYNYSSNQMITVAGGASQAWKSNIMASDVNGLWNQTWIGGAQAIAGMWYDTPTQTLYIADKSFHRLSKVSFPTLTSTWIAGGGPTGLGYKDGTIAQGAGIASPSSIRYRPETNSLLFIDSRPDKIRILTNIDGSNGAAPNVTSLIGGGYTGYLHIDRCGFTTDPQTGISTGQSVGINYQRTMTIFLAPLLIDPLYRDNFYIANMYCMIYYNASSNFISPIQFTNMPPILRLPTGDETGQQITDMVMTSDGLTMYQMLPWNHSAPGPWYLTIIRNRAQTAKMNAERLVWDYTIICGLAQLWSGTQANGPCDTTALLSRPSGFALDEKSKRLYFTDSPNIRYLWPIDSDSPSIYYLMGKNGFSDGNTALAKFGSIGSLIITQFRGVNVLFVGDNGNGCIRMIDMTNSSDPQLYSIAGLSPSQSALAGSGQYQDGWDHDIRFNGISYMSYDGDSTIYIAETGNNKIRVLTLYSSKVYNSPSSSSSSSSSSTGKGGSSSSSSSTAPSSTATSSTAKSSSTATSSTGTSSTTSNTAPSSSTSTSYTGTDSSSSSSGNSSSSTSTTSSTTDSSGISQSSSSSSSTGDQLGSASSLGHPSSTLFIIFLFSALTAIGATL